MKRPSVEFQEEVLSRMAATCGNAAALQLAQAFGGREIDVPKKLRRNHPLVKALGRETAETMIREFGAGRLLIPMGPTSSRRRVAHAIAEKNAAGASRDRIAAEVGVHIRTVSRHRRRIRDERQGDLFDRQRT